MLSGFLPVKKLLLVLRRIKRLPPELEHLRLGEFEILDQGGVNREDPRPDQGVAAHVSEGSRRLGRKRAHIEEVCGVLLVATAPGD